MIDRAELDELRRRVERLESLEAIGDLVHRYAISADARDLEGILSMFVEDVDCGRLGTGREALRQHYEVIHRRYYRTIHQVVGVTIDLLDADHAKGRVVMRAEHEIGDDWIVVLMCMFDQYERRDGAWYFVRRAAETWYATPIAEAPHGPDWATPGRREPRLPQRFPTWSTYWSGHEDAVRKVTRFP